MSNIRKLFYVFRGEVEIEEADVYKAGPRARQLQGCTGSAIYTVTDYGRWLEYGPDYWVEAKAVPDEIKFAAMLVN